MFENVKSEIPDFLKDEVVYCDTLSLSRGQRSCLILLRNIVFYVFHNKETVSNIDLNATCLSKVVQQISNYNGRRGKWFDQTSVECPESQIATPHKQAPQLPVSEISFGKYIYQSFATRKLFLLIKCWDKLVVLRSNEDGDKSLELEAQYEGVSAYRLVHGKMKFQASVELRFLSGEVRKTDFHDGEQNNLGSAEHKEPRTLKHDNLKPLPERIRIAKTELLMHKSITQREFARLKNTQTFGCNFLRSAKIEEKQLLLKCGDVWVRLTANDFVVIGVPVINNASSEACTVLRNVRPVLKSNEAGTYSYAFRLYQLNQSFIDLETVETFFQCEDEAEILTKTWGAMEAPELLPELFAVLCIKIPISQAITMQRTPLFVFFDVERDITSMTRNTKVFNQQVFIKDLDFNDLLSKRHQFEIMFKKSTMHQDFLAIAMANVETKLALTFATEVDLQRFEELLVQRFDFQKLTRCQVPVENQASDMNEESNDSSQPINQKSFSQFLYYNRSPMSVWYGAMIVRFVGESSQPNGMQINWKLYTTSEEKSFMLLKLVLNELVLLKCNVTEIAFPVHKFGKEKIIEFENALRKELNCALECCDEEATKAPSREQLNELNFEKMLKLEMQTDLMAKSLKKT